MHPVVSSSSRWRNELLIGSNPTRLYKSNQEYLAAVNQWLWQCYDLQIFATLFPFWASYVSSNNRSCFHENVALSQRDYTQNSNSNPSGHTSVPGAINQIFSHNNLVEDRIQGHIYLVPSLWKRVVAEFIDFSILLVLKAVITYIAVDFFDLIDMDKYDLSLLKDNKMDYNKAMELTSEIIALEVIHRFMACIFEALYLRKGIGSPGGCTPGKSILNLKVVSCHLVSPVDVNHVRVRPAADMGFAWALLRAFIKNFSVAFVFPMCFTMFFFQYNRAAYDIICSCIVVEELPNENRRE